jgi:hypothetical protein
MIKLDHSPANSNGAQLAQLMDKAKEVIGGYRRRVAELENKVA